MKRTGYYSPVLRRDLVTRLYFAAKKAKVPMTTFNDQVVEAALNQMSVHETAENYQVEQKQSAA
jgi:hypothetical protein